LDGPTLRFPTCLFRGIPLVKTPEDQHGDDVRSAWIEEFDKFLPEVQPFAGAQPLLEEVRERGLRLVLASSGESKHVDHYLDLLNGRELAQALDDVRRRRADKTRA